MPRATVTFEYETVEKFGDDLIFKDGVKWVAVCLAATNPTFATDFVVRDKDGKLLKRVAGSPNVLIREATEGAVFAQPLEVDVYDDKTQVTGVTLKREFYIKFVPGKPILPPVTEPEPEPIPVPAPPEDVEPYRVIWNKPATNPGVNVREDHNVNSADIGDIPLGATIECDTARFFIGEYPDNPFGWLPITSGPFTGKWVAFYQFGAGGRYNIVAEYLVLAEDWTEPEPQSPTVQLAGAIQLEKRPDGYYRLTNVPPVGFNLRRAIHYSDPNWQDLTLDWMKDNGFGWVRTYVAREGVSLNDCIARTETFVNKAKARGIKVCLVITDSLRDSGHIIDGMIPFHKGPQGHVIYTWFTEKQYTGTYYQWVDAICTHFSKPEFETVLGMIDLGNEFALYPVSGGHIDITQGMTDAYIDCFAEAARIAYTRTGGRVPVTCGWINANHFKPAAKDGLQHARDAARIMKYIHLWGCHVYAEPTPDYHPVAKYRFEQDCINFDFIAAKETGKALGWPEFGCYESNWDRAKSIVNFMGRNPMVEIRWYWGVGPLPGIDAGDSDGHALVLGRDGPGEFWDCVNALKT
jgi:hypothetical protein